jgi:hypothetical protein
LWLSISFSVQFIIGIWHSTFHLSYIEEKELHLKKEYIKYIVFLFKDKSKVYISPSHLKLHYFETYTQLHTSLCVVTCSHTGYIALRKAVVIQLHYFLPVKVSITTRPLLSLVGGVSSYCLRVGWIWQVFPQISLSFGLSILYRN